MGETWNANLGPISLIRLALDDFSLHLFVLAGNPCVFWVWDYSPTKRVNIFIVLQHLFTTSPLFEEDDWWLLLKVSAVIFYIFSLSALRHIF